MFFFFSLIPNFLSSLSMAMDNLEIDIKKKNFFSIVFFVKYHLHTQMNQFIDLVTQDFLIVKYRFSLLNSFVSTKFNNRIKVQLFTDEIQPISSILKIYPAAEWAERETWDMFGIFFYNSSDLRRILTDYGFQGYPLRKDFPLSGYYEIFYSELDRQIAKSFVSLAQEFRVFNTN